MMKGAVKDVSEAIGNTPIVKLNRLTAGLKANIYCKLGYLNPGGSVKDRIALNIINEAEKRGELKPGGTMVYSTCSLEPEENEGVITYLLENVSDAKVLDIDIPIKKGKIVLEFEGKVFNPEVKKCLRLWPQDNDTEGFFVAKLQKEEQK